MASPAQPGKRIPLPVVRLSAAIPGEASSVAQIAMRIAGEPVRLEITAPVVPVALERMLPILQGLTNAVVDVAVQRVEREGKAVSCRAGCGACCRQMAPISESEARLIASLVRSMPAERRTRVEGKFAAAIAMLQEANLLASIRHPGKLAGKELRPLGQAYFRLGIACPFLEDESCSIHADRPLACREYLVTSPAENCRHPDPDKIDMVPLPAHIASVARELDTSQSDNRWIALVCALEWTELHPHNPPVRSGPEWLTELFQRWSAGPTN